MKQTIESRFLLVLRKGHGTSQKEEDGLGGATRVPRQLGGDQSTEWVSRVQSLKSQASPTNSY